MGSSFLAECGALESVRLPPSVVSIGDNMLYKSGVKTLDLSHCTALTTLGSSFLQTSCSALESPVPRGPSQGCCTSHRGSRETHRALLRTVWSDEHSRDVQHPAPGRK
eukprot:TRINITY_DN804_c0_g1_i12.p4 TRINITY_DN804_c0_g1~~TRINITY_DN804_c0_g1_i12.p4  ORF type:complete len:108 (+),score=7.62 TRINITY_DN804_c0_g1_i12:300-623(+)